MRLFKSVIGIIFLVAFASVCAASPFEIHNGYIKLSGDNGVITSLRFDPSGKGNYGHSPITSMSLGVPIASDDVKADIENDGSRLVLRGMKFKNPIQGGIGTSGIAVKLELGHTLGQTFEVPYGFIQSVSVHVPTYGSKDSAITLSLYQLKEGDTKVMVASKRFEDIKDNSWVDLNFPDQPEGRYMLEMSDVKGSAGWWGSVRFASALLDGKPQKGSRSLRYRGYEVVTGSYKIDLIGNKLKTEFSPGASFKSDFVETQITMPWVMSGYDTTGSKIMFDYFVTDTDIYKPVHQFKRRTEIFLSGERILMSGRFGADLMFIYPGRIACRMSEDKMTLAISGTERQIEVLPHPTPLSSAFPVFYSSDKKTDKILNEFLLSHNFNFGVGTNSDWKEWHTLQLSWTANAQSGTQNGQFLDYPIAPDGYVYTWGPKPGWPFPFKDADKDGKNDYDTRHFTTNPSFITGAWREYCWKRASWYLTSIMPRVRSAMEFMLKELDGDKGILVIKAPGHEGKSDGIGSNYWDILPFGYKDAYTNTHYYPALEAMAQLEEAALKNNIAKAESSPEPRSPAFYRELAEKVRKSYNGTFWLKDKGRYSGCVDVDGVTHDYGFTFVNLPAMAYGLASPSQVERIYEWMEHGITSSGKADTYSRWIFAPRASTILNPRRNEPQTPKPSWWHFGWGGTDFDGQCQAGGAILYTSYYDIVARAKYLGADNAWKRFSTILDRYNKPDHLSGGSPLFLGEKSQGGGGGSVGVESEFPESGLVPVSFLYAFLGIDADVNGLKIRPSLPKALTYAGVKNLRYAGKMYDINVTNSSVTMTCTTKGSEKTITKKLAAGEVFRFTD